VIVGRRHVDTALHDPAVGGAAAAAVSLLANRAPGGSSVAVILESVVLGRGQIRLPAVLLKALASLAALCTGGSIGREGPIIQFGGGSGSLLGRAVATTLTRLAIGGGPLYGQRQFARRSKAGRGLRPALPAGRARRLSARQTIARIGSE
jgi:hypothetical protein